MSAPSRTSARYQTLIYRIVEKADTVKPLIHFAPILVYDYRTLEPYIPPGIRRWAIAVWRGSNSRSMAPNYCVCYYGATSTKITVPEVANPWLGLLQAYGLHEW